jgi:hypothetical protein
MQKKNIQPLKVMDILQDQKINFSLVTGLRGRFLIKKDTKMAELNTGDGGGKKRWEK